MTTKRPKNRFVTFLKEIVSKSLFFIVFPHAILAQNKSINSILLKIDSCQIRESTQFYSKGLFPSQRIYFHRKNYVREDDNIFFTGLAVWTLRSNREFLSEENKTILDSICSRAVRNYPNYKNKNGDCTYNFWVPNVGRHFPNDKSLSKRKKYALPDDLDDTAILYLSEKHSDSLLKCLKSKISEHSNGNRKNIHNTFGRYKHRKAYNTWFGKDMPVDFDLSVQCNSLRFVLDHHLSLNRNDSATIQLVQDMVLADEHVKYPHFVSPHYQNTSIVLYHLARLVAAHPNHFVSIRPKLIQDIETQFGKTRNPMEQLLLNTSLARFGLPQKELEINGKVRFDGFYFFVANMTSVFPNPIKCWLAKSKWTNFYYQSEGYYWTLLFENECFKLREAN